jgi:hypothetical protein
MKKMIDSRLLVMIFKPLTFGVHMISRSENTISVVMGGSLNLMEHISV